MENLDGKTMKMVSPTGQVVNVLHSVLVLRDGCNKRELKLAVLHLFEFQIAV